MQYESISPLMLKNVFRHLPVNHGKGNARPEPVSEAAPTLLEVADKQVSEFEEMVRKTLRSAETFRQWRPTRRKIEEFIRHQFKTKVLELSRIEFSFAQKFYTYLTVKRKVRLQDATAKKQLKNTRQILSPAEANGCIPKNPIEKFHCGTEEKEIISSEKSVSKEM